MSGKWLGLFHDVMAILHGSMEVRRCRLEISCAGNDAVV